MSELRYWDSCTFLAWLTPENERVEACRGVLDAAKRGDVRLVTSTLTLTEVIKLKGGPPLGKDKEEKINQFFMHEWIIVHQLDRKTAELARRLIWEHGVHPKDSIHVATALRSEASYLDTYDEGLLKLAEKMKREHGIIIDRPNWTSPTLGLFGPSGA